jgi:formylglycine-generating enzyme required for sulfatase activity
MKRWAILGGVVVVAAIAVVVILKMSGKKEAPPPPRVEVAKGPDPSHLARITALAKEAEELEAKGDYKEALANLKMIANLEPNDPRLAALRPRLEEKLKRWETWRDAHQKAEIEKKEAQRLNTTDSWSKVLALIADAEKLAPMERFQTVTRALLPPSRQYHLWAQARDEEKKANFAGAIDLAGQAIAAVEAPAELTAYKTALEKKKRKQEFDRAASAAAKEAVPAKSYELWQAARALADDPKDTADVDAKLNALKPWVDPAERDKRYEEAMKAGETALTGGEFDAAEKSFKEAQALKVTELKPRQALTRVAAARTAKTFDTAVAEAKAAEGKKQWADAIDAYDRALKVKMDSTITARRKEIESRYRPPKITVVLNEQSGVKMEFVLIKRGTFQMGDATGASDEKVHPVTIAKDFWMQTTELTQAHWGVVMNTKPWMSQSVPHMPVEGVNWEDTQKFFEKFAPMVREQFPGRNASLPTEAEWEYACRAGTTSKWYFGNDESQFDLHGWSVASKVRGPQTVAQKPANAWGLFDMHGNVAEWVSDAYAPYDSKDPADASYRIFRGGSWNDRAVNCRSAKREKDLPTKSNLFLGFRAVIR